MQRFDLLHSIHKALRHAMLTFNIESGRIDYSDPEAVSALCASWSQLRDNLGNHAHHEDEIMFPLLSDRAPGEPRDPFGWQGEVEALEDILWPLCEKVATRCRASAPSSETTPGGTLCDRVHGPAMDGASTNPSKRWM